MPKLTIHPKVTDSVTGQVVPFDSAPVLQDPNNTYGLRRDDNGQVLVAAGTLLPQIGDNDYSLTVTIPAGVSVTYYLIISVGGSTHTERRTYTAPTALAAGKQRGIKLIRSEITPANHLHLRGFRMRIEVSDVSPSDVDPYVFVYRRNAPDVDGVEFDTFMTVASFPDLAAYPRHEPDNANRQPFFRLKHVELDFRSTAHADRAWELILASVGQLCAALDRADTLTETVQVWVGDPGADSLSLSEESEV